SGLLEDPLTPFMSWIYVLAVALIFYTSVHFGVAQALFAASGFLTLVMVGSVFRSEEAMRSLGSELPLDLFLFFSLATLPGLIVEIYEGGVRWLEEERTALKRKIQGLNVKLSEASSARRAQETAKPLVDEQKWNRRGLALADAARRTLASGTIGEVLEALGDAFSITLSPSALIVARADKTGALVVSRAEPDGTLAGQRLDADDPALREAVRAARPHVPASPLQVGKTMAANLLVPVIANRSLVAVVGLTFDQAAGELKDEQDCTAVLSTFAQEVIVRSGLA
ncbi:MAG: hypothetical protein HY815_19310, partial [Candidatus Riflebacteria bacterium]|nr:hypothetical protein [Candidatus Riflebacteria bacterium]